MFSCILTCSLLFLAFGQNDAAIQANRSRVLKWWEIPPKVAEVISIYSEAAQMAFSDGDVSEKEDFKIHLREMIKYSLPNLPIDSVEKVADHLISSGVTQLSDMNLINETDLAGVLKPIQARKLIYPFSKNQRKVQCPTNFYSSPDYERSCFTVIAGTLTWEEAAHQCRQMNPAGVLAVINSDKKSRAIDYIGLYHNPSKCRWVWHSLVRYINNFTSPWYYRTLSLYGAGYFERPATYFNWLHNEPDFTHHDEFCVQRRIASWKPPHQDNDMNCWTDACALCEVQV